MSQSPLLSIITVSYNTKEITENCLKSIYTETTKTPFELIVMDNNSTDGSVQMLEEFKKNASNFRLLRNSENLGFGKGNNKAALAAKGDYLLFLNSDTIVLQKGIDNLFNFYTSHEGSLHFLGGKLLNKDKTPQPSCGPFYTLPIVFAALFLKGDYHGITRYSPDIARRVDWVSGACILTKKEYFQSIGGFDEHIFMYMEEIDLLFRARKQRFLTWFTPSAQFIHLGSASSNGKTFPILQVYRGFLYFYKKHYSPFLTVLLSLLLQLKAVAALIIGLATGNKYLIKTYAQAYRIASMG